MLAAARGLYNGYAGYTKAQGVSFLIGIGRG